MKKHTDTIARVIVAAAFLLLAVSFASERDARKEVERKHARLALEVNEVHQRVLLLEARDEPRMSLLRRTPPPRVVNAHTNQANKVLFRRLDDICRAIRTNGTMIMSIAATLDDDVYEFVSMEQFVNDHERMIAACRE